MKMVKLSAILAVVTIFTGCLPIGNTPAESCLDSFKMSLKDPNSGKVVDFKDNLLTYTATNSYGARIQGKAICKEIEGKWQRDKFAEMNLILDLVIRTMEVENSCLNSGGSYKKCTGESNFGDVSVNDVKDRAYKKAAKELGFD